MSEKKYPRELLRGDIIEKVMPIVWMFYTGKMDYDTFIENMINFLDGWVND